MAFLILSFGLWDSPVFADGCQTFTWGRSTSDYRQLFEHSGPAGQACRCVIGYCWSCYLGYYINTTWGSLGPVKADEIVVGGLTQVCESSAYFYPSCDVCYTGSTTNYPVTDTTIAISLESLIWAERRTAGRSARQQILQAAISIIHRMFFPQKAAA